MNWLHRIRGVKSLFDDIDELSEPEVKQKTNRLWAILKMKVNESFMHDFVEEFENQFKSETMSTVQDINELLEELYNYCDWNYIWVD